MEAISRPMPRPPPVTSACEEGGNPDMRQASPNEFIGATLVYILDFKLLQEWLRMRP
jgi:hypothetical protein